MICKAGDERTKLAYETASVNALEWITKKKREGSVEKAGAGIYDQG